MGKEFEAPKMERTKVAIKDIDSEKKSEVTVANQPTEVVPNNLVGIYKSQIDNFKLFLEGNYASNNTEERDNAQLGFIQMVNNILSAEFPVMQECMNYFVKTIRENPIAFTHEKLTAPYWGMKKRPNLQIAKPYLIFIDFIVSYSKNIQRKMDFLKGYDTTTFLSYWNEKQAKNIQLYLFG